MNGLVPLLLIGAVLLFIVLALQNVRPGGTAKLPVEAKPLMSATERQIIALLEEALPQARVHAKVAMGAIVKTRAGLSQRQRMSVRGRFSQKIVDFVLEDRASGRILALVEHGNGARKAASERSGTRSPARPVTRPSACPTRAGQRPPASATSCWPPFPTTQDPTTPAPLKRVGKGQSSAR